MIKCKMSLSDDVAEIQITGHAGYAPMGQDIVCAAATTLCNTLVGYLGTKDEAEPDACLEKGNIRIKIDLNKYADGVREVISYVAVGFQIIAYSFPGYFQLDKDF